MKETIAMVVTEAGLAPSNKEARAVLDKLTIGDRILVTAHKPRNPKHHRLFWVLLTAVSDGIGQSPEAILTWLKYRMGRVDFIRMPDGMVVPSPHSISFASMDQANFRKFYEEAVRLITEELYSKIDDDEKRLRLEEILAA